MKHTENKHHYREPDDLPDPQSADVQKWVNNETFAETKNAHAKDASKERHVRKHREQLEIDALRTGLLTPQHQQESVADMTRFPRIETPVELKLPKNDVSALEGASLTAMGTGSAAILAPYAGSVALTALSGGTLLETATFGGIPLATGALGAYLGKKVGHPIVGGLVGGATGAIAAPVAVSAVSAVAANSPAALLFTGLGGAGLGMGALAYAAVPAAIGGGAYLAWRGLKKWRGQK